MNERLLVVDDDPPVRRMLERTLAAEGFHVDLAADGAGALVAAERSAPDVVVIDIAMPGLDGLAVCRRLRAKGVPAAILMLTARDAVPDRVAGLEAGADDYLVKPFASEELIARIHALLRRRHPQDEALVVADLALDPQTRTARRGDREIRLTARETALLAVLMRDRGQVVSRERALEEIWRDLAVPNVVDRYVARLRAKLGQPSLIHTVHGVGFMLRP